MNFLHMKDPQLDQNNYMVNVTYTEMLIMSHYFAIKEIKIPSFMKF